MKASVYLITGEKGKEITLPIQFSEPLREDVIHRASLGVRSKKFQPKSNYFLAGRQNTAEYFGVKDTVGTMKNIGHSRLPRLKNRNIHAGHFGDVAGVPFAKGGPRAHPPKVDKVLVEKVNKKENRLAIRSAIAATASKEVVQKHGHSVATVKAFPLIVENGAEKLDKTSKVEELFSKLGLIGDVERAKDKKKVRAGVGKTRGRRYKKRKGPLVVVSADCPLASAAINLEGVEVVEVNYLNAELLAPGAHPGRLTIWTEGAVERLGKEKLFA